MKPSNNAARGLDTRLIISDFAYPRIILYAANVVKVRRHYIRWAAQRQIIHRLRLQAQQIRMDGDAEQESPVDRLDADPPVTGLLCRRI